MQAWWHGGVFIDMIETDAKTERNGCVFSRDRDEIAHAQVTIAVGAAQGTVLVGI